MPRTAKWVPLEERTVKYARVDGTRVCTCGYEEDALGLTPLVVGWGHKGYYLPSAAPRHRKALHKQLRAIDWRRVLLVKQEFEIQPGRGCAVMCSSAKRFITIARYQRLMRACLKDITDVVFERELRAARKQAPDRKVMDQG